MGKSLGEKIHEVCAEMGVTLNDQSIALGRKSNQLSRWSNGVEPKAEAYGLLMGFLDVTLAELGELIVEEQLRHSGLERP